MKFQSTVAVAMIKKEPLFLATINIVIYHGISKTILNNSEAYFAVFSRYYSIMLC